MTTNPNIDALIDFLARQMDGEPVPPTGSQALGAIETAIRDIHKYKSDQELHVLALRTIGAIIDRVGSNIAAEQTLRNFIQPGGRA
ncbi:MULTISPECIES: hypothetical protein [unclassified Variovorax]|uniref:hypothetical protein n=1 Tax=unclassified Variovorax TaxID=663243 RepID=UPI00076BDDD6|nr:MULTISPECIES: hypothetical protein [unclassified Variovorax]KWT64454.1 hypothetical protein APY03_7632 [Variovorax sp. WDL1]PNG56325.1 hypothetical protein CHC07_02740 [Variovorax sp. B4]PNG57749.1 hypothetical protein CHC06_02743 [Variovorax sp. B2]VTV09819.1 hypothetical protein WDL1CHR_00886 [Variovorax sp. WDL1]